MCYNNDTDEQNRQDDVTEHIPSDFMFCNVFRQFVFRPVDLL